MPAFSASAILAMWPYMEYFKQLSQWIALTVMKGGRADVDYGDLGGHVCEWLGYDWEVE